MHFDTNWYFILLLQAIFWGVNVSLLWFVPRQLLLAFLFVSFYSSRLTASANRAAKRSTPADLSQMMVFAAEPQAGRAGCALQNTHTHTPFTFQIHTALCNTHTRRQPPPTKKEKKRKTLGMQMGQSKCKLSVSVCCHVWNVPFY